MIFMTCSMTVTINITMLMMFHRRYWWLLCCFLSSWYMTDMIKQTLILQNLNNNQHHTTTKPIKTIKKPWPLHSYQVPHQHCSVLLLPPDNSHLEYNPITHYWNWKPHSFSSSNHEPPFQDTQSPKLPVKQTNKQTKTNKQTNTT